MLENVAYKLSVSDVLKSRKGELPDICTLKLNAGSGIVKVLRLNYVWVQGRIDTVINKSNKISLKLKDETGTVRITYIGKPEIPWISSGVYCSAVGKITQNGIAPEVEAVKMANLSRNPVFEQLWPYEVKELKLLFLNLIEPRLIPYEEED